MIELGEPSWYTYVAECDQVGLPASISDYLIWLDEQGEGSDD